MSDKEILEKAIQKAIDCGWDKKYRGTYLWNVRELAQYLVNRDESALLIFNHDFAKALWGENSFVHAVHRKTGEPDFPLWKYHLQQMVISDDPIEYLGKNI